MLLMYKVSHPTYHQLTSFQLLSFLKQNFLHYMPLNIMLNSYTIYREKEFSYVQFRTIQEQQLLKFFTYKCVCVAGGLSRM